MSKLLNMYENLKRHDKDTFYLFKNGAFYLALEDDARELSEMLGLKLTKLNDEAVKCGFPCTSFDKYYQKMGRWNIKFKIIDKDTILDSANYMDNLEIKQFFDEMRKVDVERISVSEAYGFVEKAVALANKLQEFWDFVVLILCFLNFYRREFLIIVKFFQKYCTSLIVIFTFFHWS